MSTPDERTFVLLKPDDLVHAADSVTAARREIRIWFP
jgi:nucleoside diphosphate kinase